jgi:hypothetical protein
LVVAPAGDPWSGLRAYAAALDVAAVGALRPDARPTPGWWREPIFCGWGAQCALAADRGLPLAGAATLATQANYDGWLAHLEGHGVVPGTIVIDDKWERRYGTGRPDSEKWPDLRGWIAERHRRGQRVLLWWKAWDPEGLDPTRTVRAANGTPVAIDPNNPRARHAIGDAVRNMLGADGLAADGLKIDFTARTPSGASLLHAPGTWGIGLLRELLRTIRGAAKRTNPDCLLVGQVVEPSLAPLIDMIRLNDQLRLDDPDQPSTVVPQMRYRAGVVQAACPGHIVDTDDWCALDLADWRAYTAIKPELGVPALYYAGILDRTLERFEERDYALIRDTWRAYRHAQGLLARETPADVGEASGLG